MVPFRIGRRSPRLEDGTRIYAIGDIHGCFNLLAELFQRIERDSLERGRARTKIIILGDMVDRGPQSAEVCRLLYGLRDYEGVVCLKGNHEKAMTDTLAGDLNALRFWLEYGGAWTLLSWGVDKRLIDEAYRGERWQLALLEAFRAAIPGEIAEWIANLPTHHREGDYFFVHAGIRPGVPLAQQSEEDMLWIREPFLGSWRRHEAVIVHGHTETETVSLSGTRIGVDTGAYRTGALTALGLEDNEQWTLTTGQSGVGTPSAELERITA